MALKNVFQMKHLSNDMKVVSRNFKAVQDRRSHESTGVSCARSAKEYRQAPTGSDRCTFQPGFHIVTMIGCMRDSRVCDPLAKPGEPQPMIGKSTFDPLIRKFAAGCHGLEYTYFEQNAERDMAKLMHILGDFPKKEDNPFDGGICFGLAAVYLGCNTPVGKKTWPSQAAIMDELLRGIDGRSASMLHAISEAFVKQKKASVISKNYHKTLLEENDKKLMAGQRTAYEQTLLDYRANKGAATEKIAIRDQLLANFSLKASPPGRNMREFKLDLAENDSDQIQREARKGVNLGKYKPHYDLRQMAALVEFVGQRNTYSMISFEQIMKGGHQMAAVGASHGLYFFDPNFGVVYLSFASGMTEFLARFLPFLYFSKRGTSLGNGKTRNGDYYRNAKSTDSPDWASTSVTFEVYRYAAG